MTISAEQRQVLLDRLAKAREAKEAKKALSVPKDPAPPKPRKSRAKPKEAPAPTPAPPTIPAPQSPPEPAVQPPPEQNIILSTTEITASKSPETSQETIQPSPPIPIPPSASQPRRSAKAKDTDDADADDGLSQKQKAQKKAYAKVVFYQQPSAKKMDKLMKQLQNETSESESESEEEEPVRRQPPQIPQSVLAPPRPVHRRQPYNLNTQTAQRTEYLRQLALSYYQ